MTEHQELKRNVVRLEPAPPGWIVTRERPGRPPDRRGFASLHEARRYGLELAERDGVLMKSDEVGGVAK